MVKIRTKLRDALDTTHEILVLEQCAIETFPTNDPQLIKRVALIGLFQVGKFDIVEQDLSVRATADDKGRISGDAGCRSRRRLARGTIIVTDDDRATRRKLRSQTGKSTSRRPLCRARRGDRAKHSVGHRGRGADVDV